MTRYLERPDGRLAYDVESEGNLVVCSPGMGDLRRVYRFLVPRLVEAGYRVSTVDLRGHGDSDVTFARYGDVATGEDLLALVSALGGPAVLVGNSMSAGAAVWAAAEQPDAVAGLVLVGPFVRDVPIGLAQRAAVWLAFAGPWGRHAWTAYYPRFYPGDKPADLDEHIAAIRASLKKPGAWQAFRATMRTSHAQAEARLDNVRAPSLVVMGGADPDFPDPETEGRLVAGRLGGELVLVPGAGHYPQTEAVDAVAPPVVRFLATAFPST